MAWSRTLKNLVEDVQDRADLGGYTLRHAPDKILRKVIESYQSLREWMTDGGSMQWVGGPYALEPNANALSCEYGVNIPLISDRDAGQSIAISHPYRLEAFYQGRWHAVDRVGFDERVKWSGGGSSSGLPLEYCVLGRGSNLDGTLGQSNEPAGTLTNDLQGMLRILVMPMQTYPSPAPYPLRAYGMASLTISESEDTQLTLDTVGFEWLILDAMIKCIMRDNDSSGLYQMATNERSLAEKRIKDSIRTEFKSSAQRSDVFANRRSRRRETWR